MNSGKDMLKRKIQNVSFVCDDTRLYLDTHSCDKNALAYFEKYAKLREELIAEYESKFGPMCSYNVPIGSTWRWTEDPWPWERGE